MIVCTVLVDVPDYVGGNFICPPIHCECSYPETHEYECYHRVQQQKDGSVRMVEAQAWPLLASISVSAHASQAHAPRTASRHGDHWSRINFLPQKATFRFDDPPSTGLTPSTRPPVTSAYVSTNNNLEHVCPTLPKVWSYQGILSS
jgi:hypothetical protein